MEKDLSLSVMMEEMLLETDAIAIVKFNQAIFVEVALLIPQISVNNISLQMSQ